MEESASMLCARVVRGTSSTEKAVTPVFAISCTTSFAGGVSKSRRKLSAVHVREWTPLVIESIEYPGNISWDTWPWRLATPKLSASQVIVERGRSRVSIEALAEGDAVFLLDAGQQLLYPQIIGADVVERRNPAA